MRTTRSGGRVLVAGLAAAVALVGCRSGAGALTATDQAYLSEVHSAAPDITSVRSDTQLVRLGHAVCDDFRAKASFQEVADRLSIMAGADQLSSADLGAVITAAADNYCPQFRSLVS